MFRDPLGDAVQDFAVGKQAAGGLGLNDLHAAMTAVVVVFHQVVRVGHAFEKFAVAHRALAHERLSLLQTFPSGFAKVLGCSIHRSLPGERNTFVASSAGLSVLLNCMRRRSATQCAEVKENAHLARTDAANGRCMGFSDEKSFVTQYSSRQFRLNWPARLGIGPPV